jgi:flagellar hook protein FlgE
MSAAFSIALSALQGNSTAIDVVGNNLANLNTTGYKDTNVDFETLMSQNLGVGQNSAQLGMGVGSVTTATAFTQGTITTTSGPMDAAIQGDGFFVVQNSAAQTLYTRDGSFQVNAAGNVVTATGENVQGWAAVNGTVNANGAISNLTVPLGSTVPAVATANMTVTANLNAQSAVGATFSAPVQVYDSLGTAHTLSVNFTETAANAWSYTVTIPAADLTTGGNTTVGKGTLTFNSSGVLTAPTAAQAIAVTGLADGAAPLNVNWNLNNSAGTPTLTQYAEASGVGGTTQDGSAAGQITDVSLENGGLLVANYSNGQQTTVGQLALASIPNPESLTSVGDNELAASASTGSISVGAANSGGRGQILAGSLESSTVDMATEFTKLLTYERGYQAASRVITTTDQLLQDTMNLIHP